MINQVAALQATQVRAHALNSDTSTEERDWIYSDLASGHPYTRLLYVTPELCSRSTRFRQALQLAHRQKELSRIVIDEAHCISEWGHDFRRDFAQLGWFRQSFPDVPIMCLTATATEYVMQDVVQVLGLDRTPILQPPPSSSRRPRLLSVLPPRPFSPRLRLYRLSPFRPNLYLAVEPVTVTEDGDQNRLQTFVAWLKRQSEQHAFTVSQPPTRRKRALLVCGKAPSRSADPAPSNAACPAMAGIIYTRSRDECEYLAAALRREGIGAQPFHAQLALDAKRQTMARWLQGDADYAVIVATTAFGMGVDKENVRFVVHWRLPKSFEGYCQEFGRAGRDGRPASCILFYSRGDGERMANLVARRGNSTRSTNQGQTRQHQKARRDSLRKLIEYCEDTHSCRHVAVCRYFGHELRQSSCSAACDWHMDAATLQRRKEEQLGKGEWMPWQLFEADADDVDECSR